MSLRYLGDERPLVRYLELKAELKRLDVEMRELQPLILAAQWEEPEYRTIYGGHELFIGTRRVFEYSPSEDALEDELKTLKRKEEATGTAEITRYTWYVICRAER